MSDYNMKNKRIVRQHKLNGEGEKKVF